MWSGPNHRWQNQMMMRFKVMFLFCDQCEHTLQRLKFAGKGLKLKSNNFSEKMAQPIKPTKTGRETRTIPDFIALTGNRSDGTSVPSKQRTISSRYGKLDESPNQTITNTNTPKRKASQMDTSDCSSLGNMNSTVGWSEEKQNWAEEVEASMLDEADSDQEGEPKGEPSKNKKEKSRKRKGKGNPATGKKTRTGPTWAEVAKHHICLITSDNLGKDLDHKDFLDIQSQMCTHLMDLPNELIGKCQVRKSGMRNGGIQLALEHAEGVNWYRKIIPNLETLDQGTKLRFFGPGERPFRCYKAYSSETRVSKDKEAVKTVLQKLNPILSTGFLAVTIVSATDDLVQLRIKVGQDLVAPLAKADNTVFYGMGTMTLTPLFGEGRGAEEDMEIEGP